MDNKKMNNKKMNNRFSCLKPTQNDSSFNSSRTNRFKATPKNSRWVRSPSPKKHNVFTSRGNRNFNNRNRGFNKRFDNRQRNGRHNKISTKFNGIEKDSNGRPMIHNATTKSFNLGFALENKVIPVKKTKSKNKKQKTNVNFIESKKPKFIANEKTQEEIEKENEWNRKMILNMQYETDSDQEESEEEM